MKKLLSIGLLGILLGYNPIAQVNLTYDGHDRKTAKTTPSKSKVEATTLVYLLKSLPSDAVMRKKLLSAFDKNHYLPRQAEEERNVTVVGWLYAVRVEADGDFHMTVGTDSDGHASEFMNMEISGVVRHNEYLAIRSELVALVGGHINETGYTRLVTPIKLEITGSLFYDVDHAPGRVGPHFAKAKTAWEIHPVTKIKKLDK